MNIILLKIYEGITEQIGNEVIILINKKFFQRLLLILYYHKFFLFC